MSKEIRLGILMAVAIFIAVWGYRFIKGQNLFEKNNTFHTSFADVTGLGISSDVTMNGYKIGSVTAIGINPEDVKKMDVYFTITGDYSFPKDTKVLQKSAGLVSGKLLSLEYDKPCVAGDCAPSGSYFEGKIVGIFGSMVSEKEINSYVSSASGELKEIISSLGAEDQQGAVNHSIRQLDQTLTNLSTLTNSLSKMLNSSSANINSTMANLNKITGNVATNNGQITAMMNNLSKTTEELSKIKMSNSVDTVNAFISESKEAVELLQKTLASTNKSLKEFEAISGKLNSKEGTMGKLINDNKMYDDLDKSLNNLNLLLQDFRLNPKRYVNISLIGKNKPYAYPEGDPALQPEENTNEK